MTGTVDGSNTAFTTANTPVDGTLQVYIDGQLMKSGDDYTASGSTVTFTEAPVSGSTILACYWKA